MAQVLEGLAAADWADAGCISHEAAAADCDRMKANLLACRHYVWVSDDSDLISISPSIALPFET